MDKEVEEDEGRRKQQGGATRNVNLLTKECDLLVIC